MLTLCVSASQSSWPKTQQRSKPTSGWCWRSVTSRPTWKNLSSVSHLTLFYNDSCWRAVRVQAVNHHCQRETLALIQMLSELHLVLELFKFVLNERLHRFLLLFSSSPLRVCGSCRGWRTCQRAEEETFSRAVKGQLSSRETFKCSILSQQSSTHTH